MRLHRPVLAGLALWAVLPVTAASAAAGVTAAGSATSTATLVTVAVGTFTAGSTTVAGHSVSIGTLNAGAQTLSSAAPAVTFTPLTVDGAYPAGTTTVTPSNSPKTVGAVSTGALPLNVLSATSPSATLKAAQTATSRNSSLTASLGSASILGMPVTLNGGLDVGSVTDASHSQAGKTLSITNVALPSLSDILAALGIDLTTLPQATLNALLTQLQVAVSSATQTAIDNANAAIDTAQTNVNNQQTVVDNAQSAYDTAVAGFDTALAAADLTGTSLVQPVDHTTWDSLSSATQTILTANPLNSGLAGLATAYDTAKATLATAQGTLDTLQGVLTDAIATLGGLVDGVLTMPLAQIGAATVATKAAVSTSKAATVTGSVTGVKVLGQDIFSAVTGNSTLDAAAIVGSVAADVNAAIASITATLSNVLSAATGATGLVVPAPSVKVLTKTTSTSTDGAFGVANAAVTALEISIGSATVPDVFALANAGSLAGIAPISGGFKTAPLSVKVGQLVEAARFRPASGSGQGGLPATGVPASLAIVALVGAALGVGTFRYLRAGWR